MTTLVDPQVARRWDRAFAGGSDKRYPNLELVRIDLWHFGSAPGRVIEYGFGSGVNTIHLAERGHSVEGVDASAEAKKGVEAKLAARPDIRDRIQLTALRPDVTALPFEDDTFDYAVAMSVLSLLGSEERIRLVLSELARVLRPGGKLVADINSDRSHFAFEGAHLGGNVYENRGPDGSEDPVRCYCPPSSHDLVSLMEPHYAIDDVGYIDQRYLKSRIHEFIVCAHKPDTDD